MGMYWNMKGIHQHDPGGWANLGCFLGFCWICLGVVWDYGGIGCWSGWGKSGMFLGFSCGIFVSFCGMVMGMYWEMKGIHQHDSGGWAKLGFFWDDDGV